MIYLLVLLASYLEVMLLPISWYAIVSIWLFFGTETRRILGAVVVGGVMLDILTARTLGFSALCIMLIFLVIEFILLQRQLIRQRAAVVGVAFLIIYELIMGAEIGITLASIIFYLALTWIRNWRRSRDGGIVVRREL